MDMKLAFLSMFAAAACFSAARAEDRKSTTEVVAPEAFVRGFPAILRVRAYGPKYVPGLNLGSSWPDIRIRIAEKGGGGRTYEILSEGNLRIDVKGGPSHWATHGHVAEGQTQTLFFDLWSLETSHKKDLFSEVPPGKYRVRVEFLFSKSNANEVSFEVVAPTEAEQAFLQEMKGAFRIKADSPMDWTRLITAPWNRVTVTSEQLGRLSDRARSQMAIYLLTHAVIRGKLSIAEIEAWPVPEYVKPAKDWLLLQTRVRADRPRAAQILDEYTQANPEWKELADRLRANLKSLVGSKWPITPP
jgi:hypothetical protein